MPFSAALGKSEAKHPVAAASGGAASPALEWLWGLLRDVPHIRVLDCGPVSPQTAQILFKRGAKLYIADLIAPLQRRDALYWERKDKQLVFRTQDFLALLPAIPAATLNLALCWHLLDLAPPEALADVVKKIYGLLEPGGIMFYLLREAYLPAGVDTAWWLDSLKTIQVKGQGKIAFPYPAISNREMEKLAPGGSVKTFLTRTGRREIVVLKPGGTL